MKFQQPDFLCLVARFIKRSLIVGVIPSLALFFSRKEYNMGFPVRVLQFREKFQGCIKLKYCIQNTIF